MKIFNVMLAMFTGLAAGSAADGQVLVEKSISLSMARTMADAAHSACRMAGFDVSVVVVDRAGEIRVALRADSANPHNLEVARRKAYTARTFGITSLAFQQRTLPDSPLAAQRQVAGVLAMGGGVPIKAGNETIGAIGISGSPSQEQDESCALAGLMAVAESIK